MKNNTISVYWSHSTVLVVPPIFLFWMLMDCIENISQNLYKQMNEKNGLMNKEMQNGNVKNIGA